MLWYNLAFQNVASNCESVGFLEVTASTSRISTRRGSRQDVFDPNFTFNPTFAQKRAEPLSRGLVQANLPAGH